MIEAGQNDIGSFINATLMNNVLSGDPFQSNNSAEGQFNFFTSASIRSLSGDIKGCSFTMRIEANPVSKWKVDTSALNPLNTDSIQLWVVTGPGSRTLLKVWNNGDFSFGDVLDFTPEMTSGFITGLPGTDRQVFFTIGNIFGVTHVENGYHSNVIESDGVSSYTVDAIDSAGCFTPNYPEESFGFLGSYSDTLRGIQMLDYSTASGLFILEAPVPCDG